MAQYRWALYNVTFNAGFRPNTYMIGNLDSEVLADVGEDHTNSLFSEAFVQVDLPSLLYGIQFLVSYDVRWREATATMFNGDEVSQYTSGHLLTLSTNTTLVPGYTISGGLQLGYLDDSYAVLNDREVFGQLAVGFSHPLAGTSYEVGAEARFCYMQDAKGSGPGSASNRFCDGWIGFDTAYLVPAVWQDDWDASGKPGRYLGAYAFPYFQKNFANGNLRTGVELLYTNFDAAKSYQAITYRVPLYVAFSF